MKKSGTIIMALAGTALLTPTAQAQTRGGFEIGAEAFDYGYRERLDDELVARDDGTFGSLRLGYTETLKNGWLLRGRLSFSRGSVDYVGGAQEEEETTLGSRIEGIRQGIGQFEFHGGKDFVMANGATVTPFVGLGARVLVDRSGGKISDDDAFGYDRIVGYEYTPIGVSSRFPLSASAAIILSAQYNWVIGGDVESRFSSIDPTFPDVKVDLESGHGLELAAMASLPVGRREVSFGPFLRRWSIDQSKSKIIADPEGSGEAFELFEPENRTTELGVRLSFAF